MYRFLKFSLLSVALSLIGAQSLLAGVSSILFKCSLKIACQGTESCDDESFNFIYVENEISDGVFQYVVFQGKRNGVFADSFGGTQLGWKDQTHFNVFTHDGQRDVLVRYRHLPNPTETPRTEVRVFTGICSQGAV